MTARMQAPMTDKSRDSLISWLRDAHSMESQSLETMERQIERLEHYPEMSQRLRQHLEETRIQRDRVAQCLARLDSDPSTMKEGMMKLTGNLQAMMHSGSGDEVLKAGLNDAALEAFEVASYTELVAAAEALGQVEIAGLCRQNLEEEKAMVQWIDQHLPELTRTYLSRLDTDAAKR